MIPWLVGDAPFPALDLALEEPNGLLCAGGDLSPQRIVDAYRHGVFPWFSANEPILWWSPDPRMVLLPDEFRISRSLRRTLRSTKHEVRLDSAFPEVIRACAETPRSGQPGTWITPPMQRAYRQLFELGFAHSVETWTDGRLAGGLYGLAIGRMFYGESMFSRDSNASKIALAHLARFLGDRGFGMIDCQMSTPHLASLGAREIPRAHFMAKLQRLAGDASAIEPESGFEPGHWPEDAARFNWS